MKRIVITLAIVGVASVICVVIAYVRPMQQHAQTTPEYGSLKWRIQQAKQKGEQQLQIASIICYGSEFRNPQEALKEALSYFAVIVAEPIEKKTYADSDTLYSWYRFRVVETITPKPMEECPSCINPGDPPSDMLPLNRDEILIPQAGGGRWL